MEVEEFLSVINECDVLRDDIDDIRGRVLLTKSEGGKLSQATEHVDKAKSILTDLFPTIRSLDDEVREDLSEELNETDYPCVPEGFYNVTPQPFKITFYYEMCENRESA